MPRVCVAPSSATAELGITGTGGRFPFLRPALPPTFTTPPSPPPPSSSSSMSNTFLPPRNVLSTCVSTRSSASPLPHAERAELAFVEGRKRGAAGKPSQSFDRGQALFRVPPS
eukprot:CAMPEP_0171614832 /NCGR_PEP_ID=MMETSP0990-20121206/12541_1 /TAXON_ID=483369 /ORGANISM="non described non described, Strain CCMP2098" /LENGTH=112 /DNA_ID=CAMNT_0012178831 /DNA_START=169 /DNA_END=507 /DNA_ORIENTATION=+